MKSRHLITRMVVYAILVFWLVISLFPFYWMFISSLKPVEEIFTFPPVFIPLHPTLENYQRLPVLIPTILSNTINSLVISVFKPIAIVFFSSLAGFAFAKFRFRGRQALFAVVIFTQLIPPAVGYVPLFIQMAQFKLIDTLWALFLPGMVNAFAIFLFRQTIRSVPDELLDAARIDGASNFRIYHSVVIPLVMPMVITQYILGFIASWNDYLWPLIAMRSPRNFTLPVAMASIQGLMFDSPWGAIMAGAVLLTIPSIIIFIALSRYIVPDLTSGALK
ncbi:MAG: carbohydrate ABC transporter permease [Anaerolineae bacterium]|nr:carbohydrate ABC transporter permease [Anaerolineae bacterium]